jgi:hypothetical protein
LRERLVLAADDSLPETPKRTAAIATCFSRLDAEAHRRMTAADTIALVSDYYGSAMDSRPTMSASVAAIRRR